MNSSLTITTGARLHFGPLSYGNNTPPFFGGVGLMIDSPRFRIEVRRSDWDQFDGPSEHTARAATFLQDCRRRAHRSAESGGIHVTIHESILSHAGLGSGTQLGLAIAQAFTALNTDADQPAEYLAKTVNRGRRSAIGIHGFDRGGFLVDAGKSADEEIGSLAARVSIPDDWRFVLITPKDGGGLAGEEEAAAFAALPPMPSVMTDRLCRIALMQLLPSLRNAEFSRFSESLFDFGKTVGEYFSPVQGGVIRHSGMRELVCTLRKEGIQGIAQSSWGPTICVVAENSRDARQLATELPYSALCGECSVHIAKPRNIAAEIERRGIHADSSSSSSSGGSGSRGRLKTASTFSAVNASRANNRS